MIASFIARCIAERVLPADFAGNLVIPDSKHLGAKTQVGLLTRAKMQMQCARPGSAEVLEVDRLKGSVRDILELYLHNSQIKEACHQVWALASPYFHHEVIKQVVSTAYHCTEQEQTSILRLFHGLISSGTISKAQVSQGIERCLHSLEQEHHPDAAAVLLLFVRSAMRCDAVDSELSDRVHSTVRSATDMCCSPPRASFCQQHTPANLTLSSPEQASGLHAALHAVQGLLAADSSTQDCAQSLLSAPGAPQHFLSLCLRAAKGGSADSDSSEQCTAVAEVLRALSEGGAVSPADIESAFCHALLRELCLQDSAHSKWLSLCLCRLVSSRVLSPVSISTITAACQAAGTLNPLAAAALQQASSGWRTLCAEDTGKRPPPRSGQGLRRAQHAATRGAQALQVEIDLIVSQLLEQRIELKPAAHRVAAMNTPYMGPCLVTAVFARCTQRQLPIACSFLATLCASGALTQAQLRTGIQRAVQHTHSSTAAQLISAPVSYTPLTLPTTRQE
eukprot:TRINITY_DN7221_c0_g2_i1.p1 TRINITY_DN7221_c0_g2~~TRINITY_DN7221_c0_g2_i1.p1  ORF type:complete len:507 (-),score=135.46 TRINITY_DN7221_c0_g2_i1:19-1539(-)